MRAPRAACGLALVLAAGVASEVAPGIRADDADGVAVRSVATHAASFALELPPGFPQPIVPPDNPLTGAKVALGRRLFHDPQLSGNGTISCASCHDPERAFSDGRARPVGATGDTLAFNAPSLLNAAYEATLTWADPSVRTLEQQMLRPLFADDPVEMGLAGNERRVLARLREDTAYDPLFRAAFPNSVEPLTVDNIIRAIASYVRTLLSGRSPFDRLVFDDDQTALAPASRRGMRLFFSKRVGCSSCHRGFALSGAVVHVGRPETEPELHPSFKGALVKAPTLRNVALTAPYMHDGAVRTLEEAALHPSARPRHPPQPMDDGTEQSAPDLTHDELQDLIAFLNDLTDDRLLTIGTAAAD